MERVAQQEQQQQQQQMSECQEPSIRRNDAQEEQRRQQLPRPTKGPCEWTLSRRRCLDSGADVIRDVKDYCRDRNMPADLYRSVAGRRGGGKFRLTDLIGELHRVFAEDRVNVEYVQYLMESYQSDPAEWLKYAKFNKFRYTRNLVDAGNGKFNLMVLCWGEGDGSSIHNHPNSDCVMKILAGQLTEVRFAWPEKNGGGDDTTTTSSGHDDDDQQLQPMREIGRTVLETDGICHINGQSMLAREP